MQLDHELFSSPLNNNPHFAHYWTNQREDAVFGAHYDSFTSHKHFRAWANPVFSEHTIYESIRHAIEAASTAPDSTDTATVILVPLDKDWRYKKLLREPEVQPIWKMQNAATGLKIVHPLDGRGHWRQKNT